MYYFVKVDPSIHLESCEKERFIAAILARGFRKVDRAEYSAWWREKNVRRLGELRDVQNMTYAERVRLGV